jgi:hypothetical protein
MKLFLDQSRIHVVKDKIDPLNLPATTVTEISYGQDVHRRVGAAIGLAAVSLGVGHLLNPRSILSALPGMRTDRRAELLFRQTRAITEVFSLDSKESLERKRSTRMR